MPSWFSLDLFLTSFNFFLEMYYQGMVRLSRLVKARPSNRFMRTNHIGSISEKQRSAAQPSKLLNRPKLFSISLILSQISAYTSHFRHCISRYAVLLCGCFAQRDASISSQHKLMDKTTFVQLVLNSSIS